MNLESITLTELLIPSNDQELIDTLYDIDELLYDAVNNYNPYRNYISYETLMETYMLLDSIQNKYNVIKQRLLTEMNFLTMNNMLRNFLHNSININNIDNINENVRITLTEEEYNNLPISNHITTCETIQCSICQCEINENEITKELPCNHRFHNNCIHQWLCNYSVYCPICRVDMRNY